MRRLGRPNRMPTNAAVPPPSTKLNRIGMPGMRNWKLYAATAPTAMKAAVPSESCPAYPVRIFKPSAASENTRKGISSAVSQ